MNKAAVWHEATQRYCFCLEPGRFLFRLQTGADPLRAVYLHTREKHGQTVTVIFHAAEGAVELPELAGKRNLVTGIDFDGTLRGFAALVFCE